MQKGGGKSKEQREILRKEIELEATVKNRDILRKEIWRTMTYLKMKKHQEQKYQSMGRLGSKYRIECAKLHGR